MLKEFSKDRGKKDGLSAQCKKCSSARASAWNKANPEKVAGYIAAWKKANRDKKNAYEANRRARKLKQTPADCLAGTEKFEYMGLFYIESIRLTQETGVQHHVDHIVPLHHGGLHRPLNLQVIDQFTNSSKGSKTDFVYPEGTFRWTPPGHAEQMRKWYE